MRKVKLNDIRIDGGTQQRVEVDQALIYQYVERMKEEDEFPLIEAVFDGATYWLTDGFHRYHAFKLLGLKTIEIKYKPGTQLDAVIASLGANGKHGKGLTIADKENKVKNALAIEGYDQKSDYEIAKICELSQSFVAGVRNPEKKEKQRQAKEKNIQKQAEKIKADKQADTSQTSSENTTDRENTNKNSGSEPSVEELEANELAMQSDMDTMYKLLESDEPLKLAHEEITRLNFQNAQLEARINGLMGERNEAVKMVKKLQAQLDKINKAKK
jgi:ParB-like chromosome segregation protein Spo0J